MDITLNLKNFLIIKIRKAERVYYEKEIATEANEILKGVKSIKGGSPREMIFGNLKDFFAFRKGFKPINLNKKIMNKDQKMSLAKEAQYCATMIGKSQNMIAEFEFHIEMEKKNIANWQKRIEEIRAPLLVANQQAEAELASQPQNEEKVSEEQLKETNDDSSSEAAE